MAETKKIRLFHLPTARLELEYEGRIMKLGHSYTNIMPPSLVRVAGIIRHAYDQRKIPLQLSIEDLRTNEPGDNEYKIIDWEGHKLHAFRVGAPFEKANDLIQDSDIIGVTSHFTFESGIVSDFISFAKKANTNLKIMVGGADVDARPDHYLKLGADYVFVNGVDADVLIYPNLESRIYHSKNSFEQLIEPAYDLLKKKEHYTEGHDGSIESKVSVPVGFTYFSRGCTRPCDYCQISLSKYEHLDLEKSYKMLEHAMNNGIKTLNIIDDNLLLIARNSNNEKKIITKENGRAFLIELFRSMAKKGIAWEFPNGLEVGLLADEKGNLDTDLADAIFFRKTDSQTGQTIGAYRMYFPVETFENRESHQKLRSLEVQNEVIKYLSQKKIPELGFGVMIDFDADADSFKIIRENYLHIKELVTSFSKQGTKARYSLFHTSPIANLRHLAAKNEPELWHFYLPNIPGKNLTMRERFERGLEISYEIDAINFSSMLNRGKYQYGEYKK